MLRSRSQELESEILGRSWNFRNSESEIFLRLHNPGKEVRAKRLASTWQLKISGSLTRKLEQYSQLGCLAVSSFWVNQQFYMQRQHSSQAISTVVPTPKTLHWQVVSASCLCCINCRLDLKTLYVVRQHSMFWYVCRSMRQAEVARVSFSDSDSAAVQNFLIRVQQFF